MVVRPAASLATSASVLPDMRASLMLDRRRWHRMAMCASTDTAAFYFSTGRVWPLDIVSQATKRSEVQRVCNEELHRRLVARQTDEELNRKQKKAWTKHYWTQEDIDAADRYADRLHSYFAKHNQQ